MLGWTVRGPVWRFGAEIVNYARGFCVLGKAPGGRDAGPSIASGIAIGWNYQPKDGSRYIGTRPSKASIRGICRRTSEQPDYKIWLAGAEEVVGRLNRMVPGWANTDRPGRQGCGQARDRAASTPSKSGPSPAPSGGAARPTRWTPGCWPPLAADVEGLRPTQARSEGSATLGLAVHRLNTRRFGASNTDAAIGGQC